VARSYGYRLETVAEAESDRFSVQLAAYSKAPHVYRYRKYFSAVEQVLEGQRLFILPVTKDEVQIIDLQSGLPDTMTSISLQDRLTN
jgi:hypothetical protein